MNNYEARNITIIEDENEDGQAELKCAHGVKLGNFCNVCDKDKPVIPRYDDDDDEAEG